MLHSIGRPARGEDLVELLLGCHGRIRSFLALALALAEAPEEQVAEAASGVRRYFSRALPLHVEDEEESVLPRLYGRSAELDATLERMRAEHLEHAPPLRRLLAAVAALAVDPADTLLRAETATAARGLLALFEPHLQEEERVLFPAIAALLTPEEQRAIVGELRARRQPP